MARYCFYIDGFNVYHALNDDCYPYPNKPHDPDYRRRKYKWLDYKKLALNTVGPADTVANICFFTTYAKWRPKESLIRHKNYIKVLRSAGVEIIFGRFMKKHSRCHNCDTYFLTHEEKRTDVNMALRIVQDALDDIYDRAVIISADSDLIPSIDSVHKYAPDKEVGVMFPIGRSSFDLKHKADFRWKMSQALLEKSQFDDTVKVGTSTITKPANWS